ncbi:sigma-70 family RNA polymerase sigma factor [Paraglaciecola sp. L3A3]|uniref:sigma-70 family RNA polymerase sigma factor n=1 Tax=Paraglaciecola sp. L3A3 TaxID=2686358 RepID=UPI00131A9356|nr:sigma-70 family RNA polymerase sigma factor [Paraglaciecola sp. L3A3]
MKCITQAIRDHESELRAFLRKRVSNVIVAEDLLQEVILRLVQQGHKFCSISQPRAWLFRVTRNVLVDYNRQQKQTVELSSDICQPEHDFDSITLLSECVSRNLARLPESDKDIVECCDLSNNTVKNYAQTQGISLPAAKARLLRVRQRLRDAIEQHCHVQFDENGKVCGYTKPD